MMNAYCFLNEGIKTNVKQIAMYYYRSSLLITMQTQVFYTYLESLEQPCKVGVANPIFQIRKLGLKSFKLVQGLEVAFHPRNSGSHRRWITQQELWPQRNAELPNSACPGGSRTRKFISSSLSSHRIPCQCLWMKSASRWRAREPVGCRLQMSVSWGTEQGGDGAEKAKRENPAQSSSFCPLVFTHTWSIKLMSLTQETQSPLSHCSQFIHTPT